MPRSFSLQAVSIALQIRCMLSLTGFSEDVLVKPRIANYPNAMPRR